MPVREACPMRRLYEVGVKLRFYCAVSFGKKDNYGIRNFKLALQTEE